jgi:hypothetical protein
LGPHIADSSVFSSSSSEVEDETVNPFESEFQITDYVHETPSGYDTDDEGTDGVSRDPPTEPTGSAFLNFLMSYSRPDPRTVGLLTCCRSESFSSGPHETKSTGPVSSCGGMPSCGAVIWHYFEYNDGIGYYRSDNDAIDSMPDNLGDAAESDAFTWYQVEFD